MVSDKKNTAKVEIIRDFYSHISPFIEKNSKAFTVSDVAMISKAFYQVEFPAKYKILNMIISDSVSGLKECKNIELASILDVFCGNNQR